MLSDPSAGLISHAFTIPAFESSSDSVTDALPELYRQGKVAQSTPQYAAFYGEAYVPARDLTRLEEPVYWDRTVAGSQAACFRQVDQLLDLFKANLDDISAASEASLFRRLDNFKNIIRNASYFGVSPGSEIFCRSVNMVKKTLERLYIIIQTGDPDNKLPRARELIETLGACGPGMQTRLSELTVGWTTANSFDEVLARYRKAICDETMQNYIRDHHIGEAMNAHYYLRLYQLMEENGWGFSADAYQGVHDRFANLVHMPPNDEAELVDQVVNQYTFLNIVNYLVSTLTESFEARRVEFEEWRDRDAFVEMLGNPEALENFKIMVTNTFYGVVQLSDLVLGVDDYDEEGNVCAYLNPDLLDSVKFESLIKVACINYLWENQYVGGVPGLALSLQALPADAHNSLLDRYMADTLMGRPIVAQEIKETEEDQKEDEKEQKEDKEEPAARRVFSVEDWHWLMLMMLTLTPEQKRRLYDDPQYAFLRPQYREKIYPSRIKFRRF